MLKPFLAAALDVLFPPLCHVCRRFIPTAGELHICPDCRELMPLITTPLCTVCGIPFSGAGTDHVCGSCSTSLPHFDAARAALAYEGASRDLIHAFKYRNKTHLRRPLALLTIERLSEFIMARRPDLIMPVPLHRKKLSSRGFNQALLLGFVGLQLVLARFGVQHAFQDFVFDGPDLMLGVADLVAQRPIFLVGLDRQHLVAVFRDLLLLGLDVAFEAPLLHFTGFQRSLGLLDIALELEPFRLFYLEDPFAPEDVGYFKILRQQCATPIAMGELFNNPNEWLDLVSGRQIDFIRCHLSQVGGISAARKIAALCGFYGVRTAWHGPGDTSPIGHAAQAHLDLATWNFGIQESVSFSDKTREVFPGCPTMENGYMHVNEAPGFGVDLNEELAARYPLPANPGYWDPVRRPDGTAVRP